MANHKSAKKRIRRNDKFQLINKIRKTRVRTFIKKVEKLKPHLTFFQSKLESFKDEDGKEWGGYDYYAKKI